MSTIGRRYLWPRLVLILAVAVYVGWAAFPGSGLYTGLLDPYRLLVLASTLKLVYLLVGAAWAFQCRDRLEAGNPARPAWFLLLLAGFVFLCAGDIGFAYFQWLGLERLDPFVHATYILSYGLIAGGAHRQLELLKS